MKPTALCSCGHQRHEHFEFKNGGSCSRYVGARPCPCGTFKAARRARGTSNSNARGSSSDRAARKRYLVHVYESDAGPGLCRCYRCGELLTLREVTVDRIIPGVRGGRYVRSNIRPACGRCNSETGGRIRGRR